MAFYTLFLVLLSLCYVKSSELAPDGEVSPGAASALTQSYFSNAELVNRPLVTASLKQLSIGGLYAGVYIVSPVRQDLSDVQSVNGTELWGLEISVHPGVAEAKPSVKFVANLHGDEPSGRQLLLKLAEWLCENWRSDDRAAAIVNRMHLYLVPTANPDGYALGTRENMGRIDLNRNFPDQYSIEDGFMEPNGKEAPETLAFIKWISDGFFTASLSLHEGALVANYPWDADITGRRHYAASPDDATFIYLSKLYANSHLTMNASTEFPGGITNGNAWYPVYGGMQDFNYIVGSCMELTIEASDDKHPHASQLERLWNENKDAFLNFAIATALQSFRGVVVGLDGAPLEARISIKGIDKDYSTRAEFGDFYRPLKPGSYQATISAHGYQSLTERIEIPESGESVEQRFVLRPSGAPQQLRTIHASSTMTFQTPTYSAQLLLAVVVFPTVVAFAIRSTRVQRAGVFVP